MKAVVEPLLSHKAAYSQPTSEELKMHLERLRSLGNTHESRLGAVLDALHPQPHAYKTWYEDLGEGRYAINVQASDSWRKKLSAEKLSITVDSEGKIQSIQVDSADKASVPENWLKPLHEIIQM
jgi:hypothetical protein